MHHDEPRRMDKVIQDSTDEDHHELPQEMNNHELQEMSTTFNDKEQGKAEGDQEESANTDLSEEPHHEEDTRMESARMEEAEEQLHNARDGPEIRESSPINKTPEQDPAMVVEHQFQEEPLEGEIEAEQQVTADDLGEAAAEQVTLDETGTIEGQNQNKEEEEFGDKEEPELENTLSEEDHLVEPDGEKENCRENKSSSPLKEGGQSPSLNEPPLSTLPEDVMEVHRQHQLSPLMSATSHSYASDDGNIRKEIEEDEERKKEEEIEEDEEYAAETIKISREQLVENYQQALIERQQLMEQNYQLQHKLSECFRRKKPDDPRTEERDTADQEQKYLKCIAALDELRQEARNKNMMFKEEMEELERHCSEKQKDVETKRNELTEYKKRIALSAINSRSGKPIPPKDVEHYLNAENRKEAEVVAVRLENIRLKNRLRKEEAALKSKEELTEGLHLIDFEQLKIENQTYNEKIEERNEELLKLRRKITNTVQVLTHVKEKLQFVQTENQKEKFQLREVEELLGKRRDILSRMKQVRDALRIDNHKIHENGGLLGNKPLLRDFEDRKDDSDELNQQLIELKMKHAELTLTLRAIRCKIEDSRDG